MREITVRGRKVTNWYFIDGKVLQESFMQTHCNETFQIVEVGR